MDTSKMITVLEAMTPLVEAIPFAGTGLAAMLGVAIQVCKSAEGADANQKAYKRLAQEIAGYAAAIARAAQSDSCFSATVSGDGPNSQQETWVTETQELVSVFGEIVELIDQRRAKDDKRRGQLLGTIRRYRYNIWHKGDDEEQIKELRNKVEGSIRAFQISTGVRELGEFDRIKSEIKESVARQAKETKAQKEAIDQVRHQQHLDLLKNELKPVYNARFDGEGMPNGCLVHTREQLLKQLYAWAKDDSSSCPLVFGLTGLAGTGKTTISISFCEHFDLELPVFSFFISRTSAERRSARGIVHTIAYQLGRQQVTACATVVDALHSNRDVTTRTLKEQVESLFIAPLRAWEGSKRPILVVIDALDECDKINGCEGGDLIPLIVHGIRQLSGRVKLLITSREEREIRKMFQAMRLNTPESSIRLQNIEDTVVKTDIERYYKHHLLLIAKRAELEDPTSWPSKADFDRLVELTGKLFVFAALVVRLLNNTRVDPKKELQQILRPSTPSSDISAFRPLDNLYMAVLNKAVDAGEEYVDHTVEPRVRKLVGTLVLLQAPLNATTLSSFLDESATLVRSDLNHLSAVLIIPDSDEAPTTTFHPSFADFVLGRCLDPRFRIDAGVHHVQLLQCCLAAMNRLLKRDICDIRDPSLMNEDVKDLESKKSLFLPPELCYACEYWLVHLVKATKLDVTLAKELNTFCTHHLLHWMEVLSLLNKVSVAHVDLPKAVEYCRRHESPDATSAASLLGDAERVVGTFDSAIRSCALQVYSGVLLLMPECKLYNHTNHEAISTIGLKSQRPKGWPLVRRTLEGHNGGVYSIAYSPDGAHIVSGSSDQTVRVWDATTGRELAKLTGRTDDVISVAFSPDGMRIASGSDDRTVRIWDAVTEAELVQSTDHSEPVYSVAFSPDGTRVASGSSNQTVQVWNATTGAELVKFTGHSSSVGAVAFSHDGSHIASGSDDKTVRLWNATTGTELVKLTGHTNAITSVTFSPDGTRIASGSYDKTSRVWDAITGVGLATFTEHTDWVRSVAFSPDGSHIASGSDDCTVRVWDATTGAALAKLTGHTHLVTSVVYSPDGTHIASGSADQTIRLWDAAITESVDEVTGHTDSVLSVAFSPDRTRIVSGSKDGTLHVWEVTTGAALSKLTGHTEAVRSVAFSPDGAWIASGSDDKSVRVWDATTRTETARLEGHTGKVVFVGFSPDGTRIVSGSHDRTGRVWSTTTGAQLLELTGHTDWVRSVTFSTEGTRIASSSDDRTARVWSATTGAELLTLTGHTSWVRSVAFSPDGARLASGSDDRTVRVWDATTEAALAELTGHRDCVLSVGFSEDGSKIISTVDSNPQQVWYAGQDYPLGDGDAQSSSVGRVGSYPTVVLGSDGES